MGSRERRLSGLETLEGQLWICTCHYIENLRITTSLPQARACTDILAVNHTRTTRARAQPRRALSRGARIYSGVQGVGGGPLAKKRVAMLRTEKTMAALLSLGSSSVAVTFCPLILPPKRFEMPAR